MSGALDRIAGWDRALTTRLALPTVAAAARRRRRLAHVVAHSGDSALWLLGAALACALGQGSWDEGGRRVFLATLFGGGAVWLLKQLFRRQRPSSNPQGLYLGLDVHSFPSGHAGRNACSVVLLGPLLPPPLQVSLLVWLGLLGLARVALGVHYVSDVLVGFVVGGCIGWVLR